MASIASHVGAQPRVEFKGSLPAAASDLPDIEYKVLDPESCQLKAVVEEGDDEQGSGVVEGYASVFGNVDLGGDVVVKGAFTKTLKDRLKKGMIKLYDSHKVYEGTEAVVGIVEEAKEDDFGLWFKARFSSVKRAQNIRTKIKEGILNAVSFGYDVIKDTRDEQGGVRYLKELRLHEISIVPWGMNPAAHVAGVKQTDPPADPPVQDPPADPPVQDPPVQDPPVQDPAEAEMATATAELFKAVVSYGTVLSLRQSAAEITAVVGELRGK